MFDDNDREQMPDTPKKDMEQKPITNKTTTPDSDFSEATGDTSGTGANSFEQNTTPITDASGNGNNPPPPPPPPPASDPLIPDSTGMEFNPLSGKVIHRDHTVAPGAENSRVEERVEEPKYEVPPPPPPKKDPNVTPGQPQQPQNPNPHVQNLAPRDAKLAATLLVDSILGGYKWAWQGASNYVKISDEQIIDWKLNDKLDLDLRIQLATGDEITMLEFYATYNANAASAFEVSDAFIESVREPMVREFQRKNWGVTDGQFIMQAFGRDAVSKLGALWQLKRTLNHINNAVFKQYEDIKKQKADILEREERLRKAEAAARAQPQQPRQERPTQQPQQQRRTPPRQQPAPVTEPEVEVTQSTQQRPTGGGGLVQSFEIPDNDGSDITEIPYVDTNSDKTEE